MVMKKNAVHSLPNLIDVSIGQQCTCMYIRAVFTFFKICVVGLFSCC